MSKNKRRDMAADIVGALQECTKKWTRTVKAEERNPASREYRMSRMTRERGVQVKEAAEKVMYQAYMKASGGGALPTNARQIMYPARPLIEKETGRPLDDDYFTQHLLPNYIDKHDLDWNVGYDARGHFTEPHGGKTFGVGTFAVRNYLAELSEPSFILPGFSHGKIGTIGPKGNFGAVLFIEKEGFIHILRAARIADRFDIAITSTKGMSHTAFRELVDQMCAEHDIPLLVLHDFDKAGFSIVGTLQRDTRRYEFQNFIEVVDLGLTLADVEAMGLEHEYQHHPKARRQALEDNLRLNGASAAEIAFMFQDWDKKRSTRRVELNAMTSPQFVDFIERKLTEHGVAKIMPDGATLEKAYRLFAQSKHEEEVAKKAIAASKREDATPPPGLSDQVASLLREHPELRWDDAVARITGLEAPEEGSAVDPAADDGGGS